MRLKIVNRKEKNESGFYGLLGPVILSISA
jgi:hypothetical protein